MEDFAVNYTPAKREKIREVLNSMDAVHPTPWINAALVTIELILKEED